MVIKSRYWLMELFTPTSIHLHGVNKIICKIKTKYQEVEVVETPDLGKILVIDGKIQSSLMDEYIYHEALVHPVMLAHENPRKVLVMGGGEGATLREVLKYKTVVKTVMVDIDEEVIKIAKKYLVEWHQGSFNDPRVKLVISDGRKYLKEAKEKFDVIILDLTDPTEGGASVYLYTKEFYELVRSALNSDGIMVTQATSVYFTTKIFATIYNTINSVFPVTRAYTTYVPAFFSAWGFIVGSLKHDPSSLTVDEVNKRISERIKGELKFYDGYSHVSMFLLPKNVRKSIAEVKEIATDEKPVVLPA